MKPIFISYSSKHRELTRQLAAAIEAQHGAGSVWWDHALESWGDYEIQIRNALNAARVVVVIWTKAAGESDWVKSEAGRANRDHRLINVRAPDTAWRDVPSPYDQHHCNDLEDIAGILRSIASVWHGTTQPTVVPLHELYLRQHGRRLIDPKQSKLSRDPREISPVQLLQASYGVVPYADVTGMKADLIAWCADAARATAGRLVHGPGGLGKTRLMIEVAAALREQGWTAGFLDRPHDSVDATLRQRWQALDQLIAYGEDNGLLIVMDYAEARQDEVKALAERLRRRPDGDTRNIRLVLLARGAAEWWTTLHDETPEIQILFRRDARGPGVVTLEPIATAEQRRALLFASLDAMGPAVAAQGYAPPDGDPPPDDLARIMYGKGHARPLAVQMEALLWLARVKLDKETAGIDELLGQVLGLERAHWNKLLDELDELEKDRRRDRVRDIARGLAQVTVVQGTDSRPATERLLMADRFYGDQRRARVAVDPIVHSLSRLYGKTDGGVAPLLPDLMGEHYIALEGDADLVEGCLLWIDTEPAEAQAKRRLDLLTVLQRATQPEHGAMAARASALLDHLVRAQVKALAPEMIAVMIDSPGKLVECLEHQLNALNGAALDAIDDALPLHSQRLMEFGLHVATRLVNISREYYAVAKSAPDFSVEDQETLLSLLSDGLNRLGWRLSRIGRHEAALEASEEAVNFAKCLAETRPNTFFPHLAKSLNSLGRDLSALGRLDEALAATQETVAIRRRLAANNPDVFIPNLAGSLDNLGIRLSDLGRDDEALAVSEEAVTIYRRLADTRPDLFLEDLAISLSNLAAIFHKCDRYEPALSASEEAVAIRRQLAVNRPDAFLPYLGTELVNLGLCLFAVGRREEALAASEESVTINRELASARPDSFLPDLAQSLNNHGANLFGLRRREEAMAVLQETVAIYRQLAENRPDTFLPALGRSLGALSQMLAAAKCYAESAAFAHEGLQVVAPFAQQHPEAFRVLARELARQYFGVCESGGVEPDQELLIRVARTLSPSDART